MKSNLPLRWQSALQGKQWLYHHSQLFLSKDITPVDLQYMNQYNEHECVATHLETPRRLASFAPQGVMPRPAHRHAQPY